MGLLLVRFATTVDPILRIQPTPAARARQMARVQSLQGSVSDEANIRPQWAYRIDIGCGAGQAPASSSHCGILTRAVGAYTCPCRARAISICVMWSLAQSDFVFAEPRGH